MTAVIIVSAIGLLCAILLVLASHFLAVPVDTRAEDIRGFFDKDGRGCIVNSSRGIIAAYKKNEKYGERDFADAARDAALAMKKDIVG